MMKEINTRQSRILEFLKENSAKSSVEIVKFLVGVSKSTIHRDLQYLQSQKKIYSEGRGKNTVYYISKGYTYTKSYSLEYFYKNPQDRNTQTTYNKTIANELLDLDLFTGKEINQLDSCTAKFQENFVKIDRSQKKKEFERMTIELSWMSSRIEGNTYSLVETELLLEKNKSADDKTKAETQMILNHKAALDYIHENSINFRQLTVEIILQIHSVLISKLDIEGIRNKPVGITGTLYRPLCNRDEIEEALENTCLLINQRNIVYEKALLANLLIAYLQPFIDGNKRTARLIGNAVLLSNKHIPLSLLTLDEAEYKRSLLLFYEQNNVSLFKKLFIEQYIFASENYFLA